MQSTAMALERYKELHRRAKEYHDSSQWEEKLRVLQEARQICESENLPDRPTRTRTVLIEISGILRRLGMYEAGIKALEESLQADDKLDVVVRAKLVGEMGIMYRHSNAYGKARDLFLQQFQLASQGKGIEADAQMCQAIGNAGMANYNLSTQQRPHDSILLDMAIDQLHERVRRARLLYSRVIKEDRDSSYYDVSQQWETVGMNRLILCYILKGDPGQAVVQAEETLRHQRTRDPTVKAFTLFFCGYAFWSHGRHREAVKLWSPPQGTTTPAIALCKEASVEHVSYLRLLAQSGVRLDSYDEQGFNALDFAVLSENSDAKLMIDIILDTYRKTLHQDSMAPDKVDVTVGMRHHQSLLRKEYRRILQEHVRPIFMNEKSAIRKVRNAYATLFEAEMARATLLDTFHYVKYSDFKALERIPGNEDKLAQQYRNAGGVHGTRVHDSVFVIFLSYRQLGMTRNPPRPGPDDDYHTQYKRMSSAVEDFLKMHPEISPDDLCLWLDCACINQIDMGARDRGIDALPFAVTQCDAMISLIDETYWTRAWCAVEVMLVTELQRAYGMHSWFEHRLRNPHADSSSGELLPGDLKRSIDVSKLQLTKEDLDRPKITFLTRQSKLLGRDMGANA